MRACSTFVDKVNCTGELDSTNSGGWDGWISLSGVAVDGSTYGITQGPSCAWTGYAWGSDAIGAISFSGTSSDGSIYSVIGDDPLGCCPLGYVASSGDCVNPIPVVTINPSGTIYTPINEVVDLTSLATDSSLDIVTHNMEWQNHAIYFFRQVAKLCHMADYTILFNQKQLLNLRLV